jgi:hypothetical protein
MFASSTLWIKSAGFGFPRSIKYDSSYDLIFIGGELTGSPRILILESFDALSGTMI